MPPVIVFKLCYFNKNQSCEDDIIDECAKNAFNEIGKVNLRNIWPEFIRVQQDVNLYRLYYYRHNNCICRRSHLIIQIW